MELSLLQPTQRILGFSFITDHVAYASTHIKPKSYESRREGGGDSSVVRAPDS